MKKFFRFLSGIIIILLLIAYVPQFVHKCSTCESLFVGAGYKPNIISEVINGKDDVLCKECARKQHALSVTLGKSIDEHKKDIEWNPIVALQNMID